MRALSHQSQSQAKPDSWSGHITTCSTTKSPSPHRHQAHPRVPCMCLLSVSVSVYVSGGERVSPGYWVWVWTWRRHRHLRQSGHACTLLGTRGPQWYALMAGGLISSEISVKLVGPVRFGICKRPEKLKWNRLFAWLPCLLHYACIVVCGVNMCHRSHQMRRAPGWGLVQNVPWGTVDGLFRTAKLVLWPLRHVPKQNGNCQWPSVAWHSDGLDTRHSTATARDEWRS